MTDSGAEHGARTSHPIIPDDFDIGDALHAYSTTPEDEQPRCPHCRSYNISHKTDKAAGNQDKRKPGDWRCNSHGCRKHFDEPIQGGSE